MSPVTQKTPKARELASEDGRRIVLAAQQFAPAPGTPRRVAAIANLARKLGALQIDSVNVLVRSHYLPIYSRCGPYAAELLDRAVYADGQRVLFEYWGHVASLMPVELHRLFRWRMEEARQGDEGWKSLRRYAKELKHLTDAVRAQIRERGPLGAGDLENGGRSQGSWWGWSQGKEILEWLFWSGEVTTAGRRNFERLYDFTERVLPEAAWRAPTPARADAHRELMTIAARALGVATARDLRDYFRLPAGDAAARIRELVEAGTLEPVTVEDWKQLAYLHTGAARPRKVEASALLSPFDSLIWERQRTEQLFGFRFRLEIYTPSHKREHGYYVLPFLLGERLVARVDLKSDRKGNRLEVRGGSIEAGVRLNAVVEPLAAELSNLAAWLGLERVAVISRRGELMLALKAHLGRYLAPPLERAHQPKQQASTNKRK